MNRSEWQPSPDFKYTKPEHEDGYTHRLDIELEGKKIGHAKLQYQSKPFAFYFVQQVYVNQEFRGQHFGSRIVEEVNKFLDGHKKPGLLINAIIDSNVADLYTKHGWEPVVDHPAWLSYQTTGEDRIDAAINQMGRREDDNFGINQEGLN